MNGGTCNEKNEKISSATKRKNIMNGQNSQSKEHTNEKKMTNISGSIPVDYDTMEIMFESMYCRQCKGINLEKIVKRYYALHCDIDIRCKDCKKSIVSQKSVNYVVVKGNTKEKYNKKVLGAVYSAMMDGRGHAGLCKPLIQVGEKKSGQRYISKIPEIHN